MLNKLTNIAVNATRRRNFSVMAEKFLMRFKSGVHDASPEAMSWYKQHAESYEDFMKGLDPDLWKETQTACKTIEKNANQKLEALGLDLGGGGNYFLLYFFVRHFRPACVVETGVAAGWSSQAILTALHKNNDQGKLFSSDFPYFRYKNPEQYVGYVVEDEMKDKWSLYIDGDRNNLPEIAKQVSEVNLFHYDSDKSYIGREYASSMLLPKLSQDAVVIFDDIQDNNHFKDYVTKNELKFKVFDFHGKYLGLTGPFMQ